MIRISLPWPPTINTFYTYQLDSKRNRCRKVVSRKGKKYQIDAWKLTKAQMSKHKTFTGRLAVCIYLNQPDKRKRDIDNVVKVLLDVLTYAEIWEDDSQIDVIQIYRGDPVNLGNVDIAIGEISAEEPIPKEPPSWLN